MQVVILAAGQGKRMRSDLPKVLQPLAGRPLLAHVIASARALDARRMCVVYGHGGEAVRERFAAETDIVWALQAPQLGTGHAVQQAMPLLDDEGATLILYGDVPMIRPETLARLRDAAGEGVAVLTAVFDDPTGYGRIVRDGQGRMLRIVEQKDASESERAIREINTGIMLVPTARLRRWLGGLRNENAQGEYYLTDVIALAVAEGVPVAGVATADAQETLGVNDKAQLAQMERLYQAHVAARLMAQGVTLRDPARIDVRGELTCGRDVEIDVGCVFEGRVVLGDRVQVGAHCVLRDAVVAADTRLQPYCHIDGATVGAAGRIGPFSRLRPGTVLAEDAHIGNFVEVKNSTFGAGSKANHLAYVGDATVGRNVNIGAGTITCNYDGANKFRTVIGDDAFIGSDTQLVAPVTVGAGATLGAGTTLTKDAPPGELTLSRARQVTIPGWKRPVKKR